MVLMKGVQHVNTCGRGCAWYVAIRLFATRADCSEALLLIKALSAENLLADEGYDSVTIVDQAQQQGMQPQILPRKNRKAQRAYDKYLYRQRTLSKMRFTHQTMARHCDTLCVKPGTISHRHPGSLPCFVT